MSLKQEWIDQFANLEEGQTLSYGDSLGPVFEIDNEEDAMAYKELLIEYHMRWSRDGKPDSPPMTREQAIEVTNANVGYWSGYGTSTQMTRVQRLFLCAHPIFGSAVPTDKEAYETGLAAGKAARSEA